MTEAPLITTEIREHLFLIGLNRPHKKNALTMEMLHALAGAYGTFERDDALRCAVVFAHGEHFTTGLDLAEVGPRVAGGEPLVPEDGIDPWGIIGARRTKPVVCAAQGWCLTAGLELLLASDIRLAAPGTRFAQLEVKRGIMPFGGATFRLPRVAGWGNAMRYLLTGDELDAEEAYRIGLVQEVVAEDRLLARATALAERVAKQAPLAVRECLRSAWLAQAQGREAAVDAIHEQVQTLMQTEDAFEGMMSFVERREAQFKGR